jgi:hypothetical protein
MFAFADLELASAARYSACDCAIDGTTSVARSWPRLTESPGLTVIVVRRPSTSVPTSAYLSRLY